MIYPRRDPRVKNCTDLYIVDIKMQYDTACNVAYGACNWTGLFTPVVYNATGDILYEWTTTQGTITDPNTTNAEVTIFSDQEEAFELTLTLTDDTGTYDSTIYVETSIIDDINDIKAEFLLAIASVEEPIVTGFGGVISVIDQGNDIWAIASDEQITSFKVEEPNWGDITEIDLIKSTHLNSLEETFADLPNLKTVKIDPLFHTENILSIKEAFLNCYALTSISNPGVTFKNTLDMSGAFQNCTSLVCLNEIDTTGATNKSHMFDGCTSLIQPDAIALLDIVDADGAAWVNQNPCPFGSPAVVITDFSASINLYDKIAFTWTETPGETYDLWNAGGLLASGVNTGYEHPAAGTDDYWVVASTPQGNVGSNHATGTAWVTPIPVADFMATDATIVDEIEITFTP